MKSHFILRLNQQYAGLLLASDRGNVGKERIAGRWSFRSHWHTVSAERNHINTLMDVHVIGLNVHQASV